MSGMKDALQYLTDDFEIELDNQLRSLKTLSIKEKRKVLALSREIYVDENWLSDENIALVKEIMQIVQDSDASAEEKKRFSDFYNGIPLI